MRLEGKVSVITGAGQGIGEAYARRFAEEGAIVVVGDVTEPEIRRALLQRLAGWTAPSAPLPPIPAPTATVEVRPCSSSCWPGIEIV